MNLKAKQISLEDEGALIERAKLNPTAFKEIYDLHYISIYRYILNRVHDVNTTNELVSNTFFKALSNLKKYQNQGYSIKTWIYQIALNEVRLYRRDHKSYINIDEVAIGFKEEEGCNNEIEQASLIKALNQINEQELEIIEMKYYENLSHTQISEILNISVSNAKVKLHRALHSLKQSFKL